MNEQETRSFPFALPEDAERRDRLAEIGQLSSGLVHELKNPLGVILLNTELLLKETAKKPEQEKERKRLQRIHESARSLQNVIQSFLAFTRPTRPDRDAVDVNDLLRRLIDGQSEEFERCKIKVSFHADEALAYLPADAQHLSSIFLNVINNARDALLDREKDRKLVIVTRSGQQSVRVVIANNGPPLSEHVAAHMFEPFYSGKETGTGLGLAIVRRLVELHNGTVQVSSDPNQGVSFTFEFPTPLGPAHRRTQLPLPEVEAVVRDTILATPSKPSRRKK